MRDSLAIRRWPEVVTYALAVPCIAAALALSLLLQGVLAAETLFLAGVMAAAWFGGTGAGLLAALLATLAFELVFLAPLGTPLASVTGVVRLAAFALSALLVSAVSVRRRRAESALREMRDELEVRVQERTASLAQTNEKLQLEITERERSQRRLALQYTVTRILSESGSLAEATPRLLQAIGEIMDWKWGALWEADREAGVLRCCELWRAPGIETAEFDAVSREMTFVPGQALPGRVWESAEPAWIVDATQETALLRAPTAVTVGLRSGVAFPILLGGETLGVIEFFSDAARPSDRDQLDTLLAIGSQIGQFIERKRAEAELRESERRYRHIFQTVGVSIWEEDFSRIKAAIEELKARGIQDFREYLTANPAFVDQAISMVRIVDLNDATLELFSAESKDELLVSLHQIFVPETRQVFVDELIALAEGRTSFEAETVVQTLRGERLTVLFTIAFPPAPARFDSVLVTLTDITKRKRAEEELRRSEMYLAEGQKLSHTGSFGWNVSEGTLYWSDETYRIFACSRECKPTVDLVLQRTHPEDRASVREIIDEAARDGCGFDFEHRLRLPDGSLKHVHIVARAADRDGSGKLEFVGAVMDITDRKRADEALRESEEQWRAVFENNPTMYFMVDADGIVLSVNPFGAEQLCYTVDELVGQSVLKVFHVADRAAAQANAAACFQQLGRTLSWELRKVRKDGTMLWVRETAKAVRIKGRPVVLIACEDITERARAEYLTRQVFESSPDGVSIVGRDYRYQRVNPVYERNWGIPAERIVGMHVAELLGKQVFEQTIKPKLDRCFAGETVSYANWFTSPLGRRYLSVSYSPLRPDSERVEAALVITHDLTEHMLAAEALREAQMELAHVTRVTMLGEITASIAHEVNQPLAAVVMSGNACRRWLDADPPNLEEARRAVQRIIDDGNRASEVIRRVRSLLQRQVPEKMRLDINDIIGDTLALTRAELARQHVSVRTELQQDLPPVVGDRVGLQQVLANLILNGIDAMAGVTESSRVLTIRSHANESSDVAVEVQDCGNGLDPEHATRIFDPFFSTKPGGLGMGLSISRSIVEAHRGRLWATPNEGAGTTIHFSLPVEPGGES